MHNNPLKYADIVPLANIDRPYTYIIPDQLLENVKKGSLVLIPLRKSYTSGIVVNIRKTPDTSVKLNNIVDLIEESPVFDSRIIKFLDWLAEYYMAAKGEVYRMALPPGITQKSMDIITLRDESLQTIEGTAHFFEKENDIIDILKKKKEVKVTQLKKKLGADNLLSTLRNLEKKKIIEYKRILTDKKAKKVKRDFIRLSESWEINFKNRKLTEKQKSIIEFLAEDCNGKWHSLFEIQYNQCCVVRASH